MTDLKVIVALQDADLEDEELQEYAQNLLPQLREFEGVEDVGLVPNDQPVEIPGMTSKDAGAFILGAIAFIGAVKTVTEIIDWIEKRWLKYKSQDSDRKMLIEITLPEGYKITATANNAEDLKAFTEQVNQALDKG
jgi:hypothetical protein